MSLATRAARSFLALLLAGLLAAAAHPQDAAAPPLSAGAAAALAAKLAHREHAAALQAARLDGTLHGPTMPAAAAAGTAPAKSALQLPFTRPLPNSRLSVASFFSSGVTAGDWNGDGLADLATEASSGGSNPGLILLRQQTGADFATSQVKGSFGFVMAQGDINGDGLMDLCDLGSKAWTFVAKPDGTFNKGSGTTMSTYAWWESLGDLNGDGRADIAVADLFGDCDCVHVAFGLATGKFDLPFDVTAGASPGGVGIADMNGDGKLDVVTLIAPAASNKVAVLPGLGDGSFAPVVKTSMLHSFFPLDLVITDADGDGTLDVEALQLNELSPTFEAVDSMLGNGDGSFTKAGTFPCSILGNLLAHGDLDGNGSDDLAVANYDDYSTLSGGGMDVLLSVGDGTFAAATTLDLGGSPEGACTADLDGDGDLDVALSQEIQVGPPVEGYGYVIDAGLGLALGRGDGSFPSALGASLGAPVLDAVAADLDGDGDADLVATRKGSITDVSALAYELATPDAHGIAFEEPVSVPVATDGHHLAAADLDNDGIADLVLESGLSGDSLRVLHNAGPTGALGELDFEPDQDLGAAGLDALQLADIDGDGAPDVLALRGASSCVDVAFNEGFQFTHLATCACSAFATELVVADVDLDGWPDAVLAVPGSNSLQVLRDASGTLQSQSPLALSYAPSGLTAADFDGDGRPDLACLSNGGLLIHRFTGTAGGFVEGTSISSPAPGTSLLALDVDRDHAQDLLVSSPARAAIVLLRGHGDFSFETAQTVASAVGISALRAADFDGDHFPDVLVIGYDEGAAQVLLSQSVFFTDAGHALAASYGTPHLAVTGEPFAGQIVGMMVSGLPAQSVGVLVIGTSAVMQPFHGGTLVPAPEAGLMVIEGQPLSDSWPAMPAGYAVWVQAWFSNGGEAAASNAVVVVTQ